jgi:hypothetical protein
LLAGGNDGNHLIVPTSTAEYAAYAAVGSASRRPAACASRIGNSHSNPGLGNVAQRPPFDLRRGAHEELPVPDIGPYLHDGQHCGV